MVDERRLSEVMVEFAHTLVRDYSVQQILDRLVNRAHDVVPVTGAGVLLMSSEGELHFVAASDDILLRIEGVQLELGEGPCLECWRTGKQVLVPDLGADRQFPRFSPRARQAGLGAVFSFPMTVDDQRLGALDVYRTSPGILEPADVAAAQVLADVATSYVVNSRLHAAARLSAEELRQRTLHDDLTGLPNRVLLHDRLEQAVAKARRTGDVAAVLFVDLDRFKAVNERLGHQGGDRLLVSVAERLRQAVRPQDTLARLSGDEFVILCEGLDTTATAENVAERVAEALAGPFVIEPFGSVEVSASVGIAYAGSEVHLPEVVLRDADAAMFAAKQHGGSRYVVAGAGIRTQP